MKVPCSLCSRNKGQRICRRLDNVLLCPSCCAARRNAECGDCTYFKVSFRYQLEMTAHQSSTGDYLRHKMRQTEGRLIPAILEYAAQSFHASIIDTAWNDFMCWPDEVPEMEGSDEFETIFIPWFLFNWIPEQPGRHSKKRRFPEKQIALHYLEDRTGELDAFDVKFIESACAQPYSFYAVTDVVPGQSLMLRDIFLETTCMVREYNAAISGNKGIVLFSRILTVDDTAIMLGAAPLAIPARYHGWLIDMRESWKKKRNKLNVNFLHEADIELRGYYWDIHESILQPPILHNTDGDLLEMHTLHFKISCAVKEAFDKLKSLRLKGNDDAYREDALFAEDGAMQEVRFDWLKKGNKKYAEWNNTLMGRCRLAEGSLSVEVNSAERARKVRALIEKHLGSRVMYQREVIESAQAMMQQAREDSAADPSTLHSMPPQTPEMEAMVQEMARRHWASWIDQKIPALGNITPRKAAQTELGREKLEALLLDFETRDKQAGGNAFAPDIAQLRTTLGL